MSECEKEREELKTQLAVALALVRNAAFMRDEYEKRCNEIGDLRRHLDEAQRAGEDLRAKCEILLYERDRARELCAQTELRFNQVLVEREARKGEPQ